MVPQSGCRGSDRRRAQTLRKTVDAEAGRNWRARKSTDRCVSETAFAEGPKKIMRSFIAIEMPSEIKTALAAFQAELRRVGANVGWTNPDSIHLTLKFLGEVEEKLIGEIAKICVDLAAEFQPF